MKSTFVNIHTHGRTGTGVEVVSLAATAGLRSLYPAPPFSIGIHPWNALPGFDVDAALREIEKAPATAIGEIGLDFAMDEASLSDSDGPSGAAIRELQRRAFEAQLEVAARRGLPVILHCVKAFEETMDVLARFDGRLRAVVFHGFVGTPEQAAKAVKRGYFLSFGMRSFASRRTEDALRRTPVGHIFLENDAAPTPIAEVYARAAEILRIPVPQLAKDLNDNYLRVFGNE